MKTIHPSGMLKAALLTDAAASGALALLQLLANRMLTQWLALDSRLLLYTGIFLLGYANLLLVLAYTDRIWPWLLRLIIAGNGAWAVACLALMALPGHAPTSLAAAYLGLQAACVLAFAVWQHAGLMASSGMRRGPARSKPGDARPPPSPIERSHHEQHCLCRACLRHHHRPGRARRLHRHRADGWPLSRRRDSIRRGSI